MEDNDLDIDLISPTHNSGIQVDQVFQVDQDKTYAPQGLQPNKTSISDGPLGEQIPNELPKADIVFKLVGGDQNKLATLQEIESQLLPSKISQETATYIHSVTNDLLVNQTDLARFSKSPSSIGLESTRRYVKNKIACESNEIYSRLNEFIKTYILNQKEQLHDFLQNKRDDFVASIRFSIQELDASIAKVERSSNMVVSYGDFFNLYADNIFHSLTIAADDVKESAIKTALQSEQKLARLMQKDALQTFLQIAVCRASINIFYNGATLRMREFTASLKVIAVAIRNGQFEEDLNAILDYYQSDILTKSQSIESTIADLSNQDAVSIANWYLNHEQEIYRYADNLHKALALTILVPAFLVALHATLAELQKLA